MNAPSFFAANDYDLAFNLKKSFNEYVNLYTKLHFPESKDTLSSEERRELTLRIKVANDDIALLVMKMKRFKSDTEIVKSFAHQTMSAAKRSRQMSC